MVRSNKVKSFVTVKDDVIRKYSGHTITFGQETPGERKPIADYTYCIKKATYAQEITAVRLLTGLDGQFKIQTPFNIGFLRR